MLKRYLISASLVSLAMSTSAYGAAVLFSVGGTDLPASIQTTVDSFRAAIGTPNNGNVAGLPSGRREINWDGGGSVATTTTGTPLTAFLDIRGAQFATPGLGFIQAPDTGVATTFGNASYVADFTPFSASRLFTPVGSNVVDATFFIPGTNGASTASVAGFGAVFTDVDLANSTSLSFFNTNNVLLTSINVPAGTVADGSLSFLGVFFNAGEQIGRVRIVSGSDALGANDDPSIGVDMVAMDDFLYVEPVAAVAAIPEPSTYALIGAAALSLFAGLRRRKLR